MEAIQFPAKFEGSRGCLTARKYQIMVRDSYPATVLEVLDAEITYPDELLCVMRIFAASKPWGGSIEDRKRKFSDINRMMAQACGIEMPTLAFGALNGGSSGSSFYSQRDHRIMLTGKLSVVTFLHEFAHALGMNEQDACKWSINLFRRCFPRQYSRLIHLGHTLIRPQDFPQRIDRRSRGKMTRTSPSK